MPYDMDDSFMPILDQLLTEKVQRQSGLYDKYIVLDRTTGKIVPGTFVLKPLTDPSARKAIHEYIRTTDRYDLAQDLIDWLEGFDNYACSSLSRDVCPVVGSRVCCAHCSKLTECSHPNLCEVVSSGEVEDIFDCEL